ncbi:hypothetical protein GCM10017783_07640 [Deinococcus piscis]|uniref:Cytochrome c-type biogenesis protein n=1 Tax=Deinococcus piscis TaxID=394230 RepID=A0ABQ3K3D6_9DEIO|nr:cytochrome c-type biogenesis protein [Deinococcus piscis]GHF98125.1 hypothetical protein GCM10017783_07640 [Deinococcus piscis]
MTRVQSALLVGLLSLSTPAFASAPLALSAQQQAQAERLQDTLRCPICTGESINESSNDISREMRAEVERLVAQGLSDREIYDHFAARYGQFVLLDPPKQGANLVLWAGPLLALGAGAWWLIQTLGRRPQAVPATDSKPAADAGRRTEPAQDPDLQPYLEQVQREARRTPSRTKGGPA